MVERLGGMYLVLEVSTFGGLVVTTYIHTLQGASLAFIAVCKMVRRTLNIIFLPEVLRELK